MLLRNRYLKDSLNVKKGISGVGAALGEAIEKFDRPVTFLEQGDIVRKYIEEDEILKQLSSPIAYDLWYLRYSANILSLTSEKYDYVPEMDSDGENVEDTCITEQFSFLWDKLKGLSPMTIIRDIYQLVGSNGFNINSLLSQRQYFIHLAAYEMRQPKIAIQFESNGADAQRGFNKEEAAGYISFPVGQLGVMEVVSIIQESIIEKEDFELLEEETPVIADSMFPPVDIYTGQNKCVGEHIIESGYVVPEEKRKNVEYASIPHFPEGVYNNVKPQFWFRYWFNKTDTMPVPGEFLGIVVKPLALPPHICWLQKTSPFLYAGNWVETKQLSSGIVVDKTVEADRTDGGIGTEYKVKIHGWEVYCYSSDHKEYEINDRVGLLKIKEVSESYITQSFLWRDMTAMEQKDKDSKTYDYLIIPISFFKKEEEE